MSNKHKHYEMIVAKAANMDLVTFYYTPANNEWKKQLDQFDMDFEEGVKYFLCLPQHNENGQCLHWLNGGEVQVRDFVTSAFVDIGWDREWSIDDCGFMVEDWVFRIKPKKEKRWILECNGTMLSTRLFTSEGSAQQFLGQIGHSTDCVQFIEIEVEV